MLLAIVASGVLAAEGGKKVVIPFDFVSKFDDGRYGQMVGDMVWKKLQREGGFVLPESMLDVRDTVASNKIELAPDTPLAKVQKIVRDDFGADIAIWGSVERVPGNEWDVYDLKIRCVDFSTPKPTVIYQVDARTKAVSEIPHLYVKADARQALRPPARRTAAGERTGRSELEEEPESRHRRRFRDAPSGGVPGAGSPAADSFASRWATWSAGCPRPATRPIT